MQLSKDSELLKAASTSVATECSNTDNPLDYIIFIIFFFFFFFFLYMFVLSGMLLLTLQYEIT